MKLYFKIIKLFDNLPHSITDLALRFSIFFLFWNSAQTKIVGERFLSYKYEFWNLNSSTFTLFDYEYDLPIIPSDIAAYMATFAEFFLSLFILFGFLTRVSAFGFLIMVAVIQIFVFPESWFVHLSYALLLIAVLRRRDCKLSLDYLITRNLKLFK